jgi:uncharacterized membrane protein YidH (DUF202 family)
MRTALAFLAAGLVLLTLAALSLWYRTTVGPYGTMETRSSVFYWIIVTSYGGLGLLSVIFAIKSLWR